MWIKCDVLDGVETIFRADTIKRVRAVPNLDMEGVRMLEFLVEGRDEPIYVEPDSVIEIHDQLLAHEMVKLANRG